MFNKLFSVYLLHVHNLLNTHPCTLYLPKEKQQKFWWRWNCQSTGSAELFHLHWNRTLNGYFFKKSVGLIRWPGLSKVLACVMYQSFRIHVQTACNMPSTSNPTNSRCHGILLQLCVCWVGGGGGSACTHINQSFWHYSVSLLTVRVTLL